MEDHDPGPLDLDAEKPLSKPRLLGSLLGWLGEATGLALQGEKTADRPHPITVLIGMLSPALALVALAVSYQSFATSERSMRIAERNATINERSLKANQRAYLVMRNGYPDSPFVNDRRYRLDGVTTGTAVHFGYRFEIANLGNTRARISKIDYRARFSGDELKTVRNTIDSGSTWVEPRDSHHISGHIWAVTTDPPSRDRLINAYQSAQWSMQYDGLLTYKDIFDDEHEIRWCWIFGKEDEQPRDCLETK